MERPADLHEKNLEDTKKSENEPELRSTVATFLFVLHDIGEA